MADNSSQNTFISGFKDGLPIGLGYLSVSMSFGLLAITSGLNWWQAVLVSITNLTSAGQVAGVAIMSASGGLIEMAISQFIINLRYSLMAISLSQKTDKSMSLPFRILLSYGITDEIFGVAVGSGHPVGRKYMAGLMILPIAGWTLGTLIGAVLGNIFPVFITSALAIGIYGMFVSIVIPVTKKDRTILIAVLISCALSVLFYYVPFLKAHVSGGFAIIISAVISATIAALFLPFKEEETVDGGEE